MFLLAFKNSIHTQFLFGKTKKAFENRNKHKLWQVVEKGDKGIV